MASRQWIGLGLASVLFVGGCASKPEPGPVIPPPPTAESLASIRESYTRLDPNTRVGLVVAVRDTDNLLGVGDVPVMDFATGDAVTIVDQAGVPLSNGRVAAIDNDLLIVRYEAPLSGQRAPVVGDLAVLVK